jgi:hypothetical protein
MSNSPEALQAEGLRLSPADSALNRMSHARVCTTPWGRAGARCNHYDIQLHSKVGRNANYSQVRTRSGSTFHRRPRVGSAASNCNADFSNTERVIDTFRERRARRSQRFEATPQRREVDSRQA